MLPKALRLPPARARRGKKIQLRPFTAFLEENKGPNNRFLFLVGKGAAKTAVRRHKIKRFLSEAAQKLPSKGFDVTIIAAPEAGNLSQRELFSELSKIIK